MSRERGGGLLYAVLGAVCATSGHRRWWDVREAEPEFHCSPKLASLVRASGRFFTAHLQKSSGGKHFGGRGERGYAQFFPTLQSPT